MYVFANWIFSWQWNYSAFSFPVYISPGIAWETHSTHLKPFHLHSLWILFISDTSISVSMKWVKAQSNEAFFPAPQQFVSLQMSWKYYLRLDPRHLSKILMCSSLSDLVKYNCHLICSPFFKKNNNNFKTGSRPLEWFLRANQTRLESVHHQKTIQASFWKYCCDLWVGFWNELVYQIEALALIKGSRTEVLKATSVDIVACFTGKLIIRVANKYLLLQRTCLSKTWVPHMCLWIGIII